MDTTVHSELITIYGVDRWKLKVVYVLQAVMSFHAAGTNVGDTCTIPLPEWVHAVGDEDPDIFYTDAAGTRNRECLSLGCFQHPVLDGRSPRQVCPSLL